MAGQCVPDTMHLDGYAFCRQRYSRGATQISEKLVTPHFLLQTNPKVPVKEHRTPTMYSSSSSIVRDFVYVGNSTTLLSLILGSNAECRKCVCADSRALGKA
jgi:hypothetical protein